jgi:hypothetical protein
MVYPETVDGRSSGQGVYVIRRILAVLVILLLLALLVPQVYQALLGPRDDPGSRTQDTANVVSSDDGGSREEVASNKEVGDVTDDVAEQKHASDIPSYSGETGVGETATKTSRGVETSEDEYGGVENIELDAGLAETIEIFDEPPIGGVELTMPSAVVDTGGPLIIQPPSSVEPLFSTEPLAFEDPIVSADPVCCDYAPYYDDPAYYGDWAYYDDWGYYDNPAYYADWAYYDDSAYDEYPVTYDEYLAAYAEYLTAYDEYLAAYYEHQGFERPDASNAPDSVTYETANEGEVGASGAYAAISTG